MKITFTFLLLLCCLSIIAQQPPATAKQSQIKAAPAIAADTAKKQLTAATKQAAAKNKVAAPKQTTGAKQKAAAKNGTAAIVKPDNIKGLGYHSRMSFQVLAGSQGIGADVKYGFFKRLSARLGAAFVPVNVNNAFSFTGFKSENQTEVNFSNAHLMLDFSPFKGNGFRLVAGAGYFAKGDGKVGITPNGTYKYGDIPISKQDVGDLHVNADWKGVAPYFGFGLFKEFPKHFLNVGLDIGSYYLQQPKVTIISTGVLSGNSSQATLVASNMKDYRFLPVIQLNFNFRIK